MPTENERKFVIDVASENKFSDRASSGFTIRQGYLDHSSVRIREKVEFGKKKSKTLYEFCYKCQTHERLIEIEQPLSERDFNDLWLLATIKLEKTRYNIEEKHKGKDYLWEIDFFKTKGETYFALAEHEMPEGQENPDFIPEIIAKHLIYTPAANDGRFTSKRLGNISYATKLLESVNELISTTA